jgi:hypothetical protein
MEIARVFLDEAVLLFDIPVKRVKSGKTIASGC